MTKKHTESFAIPLGPFVLQSPIRRGGMGEVWRGIHREQGTPVAIKVMMGARARQRRYRQSFLNEVRAVASLNHPAIVMIFDYGTVPPEAEALSDRRLVARSPYIVMELASRGSLDQIRGIRVWSEVKRFLLSLLDALAHAHARGVVHRDIKPANILLAGENDLRPGIKLTDFGLAHATGDDVSELSGSRAGTPRYMAPELFEGQWRDYGPWTDLYAVGCMAFEFCSNKPMFDGESFQELKRQHLYNAPPPLEPLSPIPDELESWIMRLVQKHPRDRFLSAADAAWALMQIDLDPDEIYSLTQSPNLDLKPSNTTVLSEMTGLGELSTFFFPAPGGEKNGTMTLNYEEHVTLHDASHHFANGRENASTFLYPSQNHPNPQLLDAHTHLFDPRAARLRQKQREKKRQTRRAPREASTAEPMESSPSPLPPTWRHAVPPIPSMTLLGTGLRLFALRQFKFIGREENRDILWKTLQSARAAQRARIALIRGPAGIGKTRLSQWFTERVQEVGAAWVMRAGHSPIQGPADGLSRMVARHFDCVGLTRPQIRRRTRKLLQHQGISEDYEWDALTELMAPVTTEDRIAHAKPIRFASPTERYVLIQRHINRLCADRAVVVWIEDVQWGADAIWFVEHILKTQNLFPAPVLFVMTARDESLSSRTREAEELDRVIQEYKDYVTDVDLGPLADDEATELVRQLLGLSPSLAERVEQRAQGNPMFAVELVSNWVSGDVLELSPSGFVLKHGFNDQLPNSIYQVWSGRLQRFLNSERDPETTLRALEIAAVLGQEVEATEWEVACQEANVQLSFHLLYKLISARLAVPADGVWSFSHGLLRETLERKAREDGRWETHNRSCASMLTQRYPARPDGISERLGRHLLAAQDFQTAFHPLLRGASERAQKGEYRASLDILALCNNILVSLQVPQIQAEWGQAWLLKVEILLQQGHADEASNMATHVARQARTHNWSRLLPDALKLLGDTYIHLGKLEHAHTAFLNALQFYQGVEKSAGICEAQRGLAIVSFRRGDLSEATALLHQALLVCRRLNDREHTARCLSALWPIVAQRGDTKLALELNKRARQLYDAIGSVHGSAESVYGEAWLTMLSGDLVASYDLYTRAVSMFEQLGDLRGLASCILGLADISRLRGNHELALSGYHKAIDLNKKTGLGDAVLPLLKLGLVLLEQDRTPQARAAIKTALRVAQDTHRNLALAWAHAYSLVLAARTESWDAWDHHVQECKALIEDMELGSSDIAEPCTVAAKYASALQVDRARAVFHLAYEQWQKLGRRDRVQEIKRLMSSLDPV